MGTWLHPIQESEILKQAYKRFFRTTWEPFHKNKYEEMTYFNNPQTFEEKPQYDLYFAFSRTEPIYDQRKLKENRGAISDIRENIFEQELKKAVPAMTSLNYGKRKPYDAPESKYNRINQIASFYRRNGTLPKIEKPVSSNSHTITELE